MLNNMIIKNFNDCLKENIKKIFKNFLYFSLISIIVLSLISVGLSLSIYVLVSLPSTDVSSNQRVFWLIILSFLLSAIFIWLILRLFTLTYGYLKINQKGDYKLTQINLWIKLLMVSFNHYYLYKILMVDIYLEDWHKNLDILSIKQKKQLFQKTFWLNIGLLLNYSLLLIVLLFLGWSFNLFSDKYFWLLMAIYIGYYFVKIILKVIFIYYLIIFKRLNNLDVEQFLNLINFTKKTHNNYFVYKIYLNLQINNVK